MSEDILSNESNPKNEVFNAYNELLRKLQDNKASAPPPVQEEQRHIEEIWEEEQTIVQEAVQYTPVGIKDHITNLKTSVTDFLNNVEVQLLAEQEKVATLKNSIDIQNRYLEDAYQIKINADTLSALLLANKEKSVALEQEINLKRQLWEKEQIEHETKTREQEALIARERQRDEEDYIYKRDLMREKDRDQHELAKRQLEQELAAKRFQQEEEFRTREAKIVAKELEMQHQFETTKRHLEQEFATKRTQSEEELKEREARIIQREQEFLLLKERVDKFPEELRRVIQDTEKNLTDTLTMKFEYERRLLEQQFETERQLHKQAMELSHAKIEHLESLNYNFKPLAYNPAIDLAKKS